MPYEHSQKYKQKHKNVWKMQQVLKSYRTMHTEVISTSCVMARRTKWRSCHAHTVIPIGKILITFHVTGLKSIHSKFHNIPSKFVGGVC